MGEGDGNSVKGHFANIMADGKLRRVDYIADDQGFHILRDTADNTGRFIKREAEAEPSADSDVIKTRMTSIMDSTSLRDSTQDMSMMPNSLLGHNMSMNNMRHGNNQMSSNMYRSSDVMGRDMSSNMMVNNLGKTMGQKMYTMGKDMSSTMMGHDLSSPMIGSNMGKMMRQNKYQIVPSWDETMMGNNVDKTMMGRNVGKTSQPITANSENNMDKTMMGAPMGQIMLGHNMDNTMMGAPMVQTMLGHNNMDNNIRGSSGTRSTLVFGFPMRGHNTYTSMMGRGMSSNMVGQDMPSHMMDRSMMGSQDMYTNANLMGHDMNRMAPVNMMSQKMQI